MCRVGERGAEVFVKDKFSIVTGFHFPKGFDRTIKINNFIQESIEYKPAICLETSEKNDNTIEISDGKYLEIIAYCQTEENANMILEALNKRGICAN